jgi:hypothetical protein
MNGWVTIMTFNTPQDAYLAQAKLESEEIQTFLKDELTNQVLNVYSITSGVKLQVPVADYDRASAILKESGYTLDIIEQDVQSVQGNSTIDKSKCPFCHSEEISRVRRPILFEIVYAILGLFSPLFRKSYQCLVCGKVWRFN